MKSADQSPKIKKLFTEAFDKKGNGILTLGEYHDCPEHIRYISEHLPDLISEHQVGNIGFERPFYLNVILWAYKDGNLPCSSQDKNILRDYVRNAFSVVRDDYKTCAKEQADLAMKALDSGINVFNYDSRYSWEKEIDGLRHKGIILAFQRDLHREAGELHISAREYEEKLRREPNLLDGFANKYNYHFEDAHICWLNSEIETILNNHPEYKERIHCIKNLRTVGKQGSFPLSLETSSAVLCHALSTPTKNSVTFGGLAHISGIFNSDYQIGHFADILEQMHFEGRPAPIVTKAMLSTTSALSEVPNDFNNLMGVSGSRIIVGTPPLHLANVESGEVTTFNKPKLSHSNTITFEEAFPWNTLRNPLLKKDVKKAVIHLQDSLFGSSVHPDRNL